MSEQMDSLLFDLGSTITAIFQELDEVKDRDDLVRVYRVLDWTNDDPRGAMQQLAMVRDEVVDKLAPLVTFDERGMSEQVIVEGVGLPLIRSSKGGTTRTDWSPLLARITARAADEWAGEPPHAFAEKTVNLTAKCLGTPPSRAPNKTGCRALGVEPDEFVEKQGSRPSVRWQLK